MKVYKKIASSFNAYLNCLNSDEIKKDSHGNLWEDNHADNIEEIVKNYLPSGSGIDTGVKFNFDESKNNKLVFNSSYHLMSENGFYIKWIDFKIIVIPSLLNEIDIKIIGYELKKYYVDDYINDCFYNALMEEISHAI